MPGKLFNKRSFHSNDISEEEGDTMATVTVRFEWVRKLIITIFETVKHDLFCMTCRIEEIT